MIRVLLFLAVFCFAAAGSAATSPADAGLASGSPSATSPANAPTPPAGKEVFELPGAARAETALDKLVFSKFAGLGIQPSLCSDSVFVRRAFLDVIGTLPTADEARAFIRDTDKNKRQILIEKLLARDEFADYWAMRWGDVLRIKAEFPVNLWPNAAQAYHRWVHASITENKPYDQFVREMLTSSGSNFRVGPVNFYRAIQSRTPEGIASAVALTFMGARTDTWPPDRVTGMAAFFSQIGYKPTREWKEENVFWDPLATSSLDAEGNPKQPTNVAPPPPKPGQPVQPPQPELPKPTAPLDGMFPDGTKAKLSLDEDPRETFANWLITSKNPWFTKCIANRVWAWVMGRGIIHEPDDIRKDNPPSNPELLAYLEKELVSSKYDLKKFYRLILNSAAYQLSAVPKSASPKIEQNFAIYNMRRLDAEVLIDAINKITGTTELYTSAIPEPFTYIPSDKPAIAIADGSITSPFLTLFGRTARATGMENERINKVMPSQWLYLLNSSFIQKKIEQGPKLKAIFDARLKPEQTVDELYLTILSRFPTAEEVKDIDSYGKAGASKRREDWMDVIWSLINSSEFLFRH